MALPLFSDKKKYVSIVIMFICFCTQITFFSIDFAKYETTTYYDAVNSNAIDPPQMNICIPFVHFIGSERATTDTAAFALGPPPDKFVTSCSTLLDRKVYDNDCGKDFYTVVKFLKLQQVCYAINITANERGNELLYSDKDPKIAGFILNPSLWKRHPNQKTNLEINIYLNPTYQQFHGPKTSYSRNIISRTPGKSSLQNARITVSYEILDTQRQPPPYKTNCRDYSAEGLESSGHCFDKCMEEALIGRRWVLPTSYWNESKNFQILNQRILHGQQDAYKHYLDTIVICKKQCNESDCKQKDYIPYIVSREEAEELEIIFVAPFSSKKELVHSPKIQDVEMFTAVTDGLSFWLSFVPLNFIYTHGSQFNLITIVFLLATMSFQFLTNRAPKTTDENDQVSEIEERTALDSVSFVRLVKILPAVKKFQNNTPTSSQLTNEGTSSNEHVEIEMTEGDEIDALVEELYGVDPENVNLRGAADRLRKKSNDLALQVKTLNVFIVQQKARNDHLEKSLNQMRVMMVRITGQRQSMSKF